MDHRTLDTATRTSLLVALRGNAGDRNLAIRMDPRTTRFVGTVDDIDEYVEVVDAIKSVPCHY